jgi:hypothetical protein
MAHNNDYEVGIRVGRTTGAEIVTDEEMERQRREAEVTKRREEKKPIQGVKLYDITAIVEDIRKDGVEGVTEEQRQEIRDIQYAKQEAYMDPGRLAMMNGETYHPRLQGDTYRPNRDEPAYPRDAPLDPILINPHAFLNAAFVKSGEKFEQAQAKAARKQDIRGCWKCFKLRRSHRVCDEHRNPHDNIMTAVPLCPHIDMRLFWDADDPANKKDSWLVDVSDVHPQDVLAHEACAGKTKSALDAAWKLHEVLEKTMRRRGMRVPSVYRTLRQLPAVWGLEEKYKGKARKEIPGLGEEFFQMYYSEQYEQHQDLEGYRKRKEEEYWMVKALRADAEKVGKGKGKKESKKEDSEAETAVKTKAATKKAVQKVKAPTSKQPVERQKLPSKNPINTEPTPPSSPKTTHAPDNRFKLSKTTPKVRPTPPSKKKAKAKPKKASPKEYEGRKSDLSEEFIYDSDEGLEDDVSTPDTVQEKDVLKRKGSVDGGVAHEESSIQKQEVVAPKKVASKRKISEDSDVFEEESLTKKPIKKQKATPKEMAPKKVASKRKVSDDSDVSDEESPNKKQKATPKEKVTQQPTPETDLATPDVTASSGPSELLSVEETPSQPASLKKRKASSDADNATASVSNKKRKISTVEEDTAEAVNVSPTDSDKDNSLVTTPTSSITTDKTPAEAVWQPTPPVTSPGTSTSSTRSPSPSTIAIDTATTVKQPPTDSSSTRRSSAASNEGTRSVDVQEDVEDAEVESVGDNESVEDEVDYGSSEEE